MLYVKSEKTKCKDCIYNLICQAIVGRTNQVKDDDVYCDMFKVDRKLTKGGGDNMNYKETIGFVKNQNFHCLDGRFDKELYNKLNEVIGHLERGEKFEKMWGKLMKYDGRLLGSGMIDDCLCPDEPKNIVTVMGELKKEYFPEEFSNDKLSECINTVIKVINEIGFTCEEIAKRLIPKD